MKFIFIIILVILAILGIKKMKSIIRNSHQQSRTFVSNQSLGKPSHSVPDKLFDVNNPHEIYPMVNALSTIVANVRDSWVIVHLQDENPAKNWPKSMGLSVTINGWQAKGCAVNAASFMKFGLSDREARYLASIPFEVKGDSLTYEFREQFDYPKSYNQFIVEEMQKGTARSKSVSLGLTEIAIQNRGGVINCRSR